jgi:Ni/Fe-hydrogenase subunit HybB-like protein
LTYREINEKILGPLLTRPGRGYFGWLALCLAGLLIGGVCWAYQIATGLGAAGINHPVMWGTYLINFVFWVGIAHSGTLISAILYLFKAPWRTPLARSAEAMTVFAVSTAGLFPFIHLGRVWIVYWILPYPNQRNLWPNFQSPLIFDVIAISTYLTVSLLFWYTGLVPDLAIIRDRAAGLRRKLYGFFSLGWTGSHRQWNHYGWAYLLFAALATPLVVSVHSVVSWDFALGIAPGWHSTIFAPYFVAGAIHSGLAMVLTLLIPLRRIFGYEDIISKPILENVAKTIVLTGLIVGYSYLTEAFIGWYSGNVAERGIFHWRAVGHYAPLFWTMVVCNAIVPLAFYFKRIRTSIPALFVISILINIGMYFERYVIILSSPGHEFDPYSWGLFQGPTWVEYGILLGSFSLFFFLFLLFARFLPPVSMTELKEDLPPPKRRDRRTGQPTMGRKGVSAKSSNQGVQLQAIFVYLDNLLHALRALKAKKFDIRAVHSPAPNREIEALMKERPSLVRYFTLTGGILGILTGFGLSVYTAWQWKFVVSGKPPVPTVPYVIESFEFCILLAVFLNLAGLLLLTRLPKRSLPSYYDPRVTEDRFSVLVSCPAPERDQISTLLHEAGAEEIHVIS